MRQPGAQLGEGLRCQDALGRVRGHRCANLRKSRSRWIGSTFVARKWGWHGGGSDRKQRFSALSQPSCQSQRHSAGPDHLRTNTPAHRAWIVRVRVTVDPMPPLTKALPPGASGPQSHRPTTALPPVHRWTPPQATFNRVPFNGKLKGESRRLPVRQGTTGSEWRGLSSTRLLTLK